MEMFKYLLIAACLFSLEVAFAQEPFNYRELANKNGREGKVTILLVGTYNCSYCRKLKESFLDEYIEDGSENEKYTYHELFVGPGVMVKDFSGQIITAEAFARSLGAVLTPSVLFLDPDGVPLSRPLIGVANIELYPYYFRRNLNQAYQKLHGEWTEDDAEEDAEIMAMVIGGSGC